MIDQSYHSFKGSWTYWKLLSLKTLLISSHTGVYRGIEFKIRKLSGALKEWYYIELTVPWPVLPKLAFSWASLVDWILSSTAAPGYQGSGVTPWEHFGSSSSVIRGTWKCTAVYPSSIQNTWVIIVLLGVLNLYLNLNSIFPPRTLSPLSSLYPCYNHNPPIAQARNLWDVVHADLLSRFSCVWLFATPWTVAPQALLSMGFCR